MIESATNANQELEHYPHFRLKERYGAEVNYLSFGKPASDKQNVLIELVADHDGGFRLIVTEAKAVEPFAGISPFETKPPLATFCGTTLTRIDVPIAGDKEAIRHMRESARRILHFTDGLIEPGEKFEEHYR